MTRVSLAALAAVTMAVATAGCGSSGERSASPPAATASGSPTATLAGTITLEGSSTVVPASRAMADGFAKTHPGVRIALQGADTGSGLQKLCTRQVDMAAASRPINAAEVRLCEQQGVTFLELPFAFDGVSVVTSHANTFLQCLTAAELARLWEPSAQGRIARWNQVRPTFPAEPIALFGPERGSGTFDYFTLAIAGAEGRSRQDYTASRDHAAIAEGVAGNPNALGYFGFAYYQANRSRLKLVAIDSGQGCVEPSLEAVAEHRYQPLSRPLFIYVSAAAAARPEVRAFAHFVIAPESAKYVLDVGNMPLPIVALLSIARRLDAGTTGSLFGGRGSVLGVTAEMFQNEDRIKNALVR